MPLTDVIGSNSVIPALGEERLQPSNPSMKPILALSRIFGRRKSICHKDHKTISGIMTDEDASGFNVIRSPTLTVYLPPAFSRYME